MNFSTVTVILHCQICKEKKHGHLPICYKGVAPNVITSYLFQSLKSVLEVSLNKYLNNDADCSLYSERVYYFSLIIPHHTKVAIFLI